MTTSDEDEADLLLGQLNQIVNLSRRVRISDLRDTHTLASISHIAQDCARRIRSMGDTKLIPIKGFVKTKSLLAKDNSN